MEKEDRRKRGAAMTSPRSQPVSGHTPTPWFVSGVRFRMSGGDWHSINRYDENKKQDENIALVGYDSRTGAGMADAHFIVTAVNSYAANQERIRELEAELAEWKQAASVEASLRREFHDRNEELEKALEDIALLDEADGHELTVNHAMQATAIATGVLGKHPSQIRAERAALDPGAPK